MGKGKGLSRSLTVLATLSSSTLGKEDWLEVSTHNELSLFHKCTLLPPTSGPFRTGFFSLECSIHWPSPNPCTFFRSLLRLEKPSSTSSIQLDPLFFFFIGVKHCRSLQLYICVIDCKLRGGWEPGLVLGTTVAQGLAQSWHIVDAREISVNLQ